MQIIIFDIGLCPGIPMVVSVITLLWLVIQFRLAWKTLLPSIDSTINKSGIGWR